MKTTNPSNIIIGNRAREVDTEACEGDRPTIAVDLPDEELDSEIDRLRSQGYTRAVSKKPGKKKKKEDPTIKMNTLAEKLKMMELEEKLREAEDGE